MISNMGTYLEVAREAHDEMRKSDRESRKPKPDGSPGAIIIVDPRRRSFKQAMIAIVFSGMYLEAALYVTARRKFGKGKAAKIDGMPYEQRLPQLGITDPTLVESARNLRETRKDLVHEKALTPEELGTADLRFAQQSAEQAIAFVARINELVRCA